jgi:hypothetical protein
MPPKSKKASSVKDMTKQLISQMEEEEKEVVKISEVKKTPFKWKEEYYSTLLHGRCVQFAARFSGSKSNAQRSIAFGLNAQFSIKLSKDQVRKKYTDLRLEYTKIASEIDRTGNETNQLDSEGNAVPMENEQEPIVYPAHWETLQTFIGQKVGLGHVDFGQSMTPSSEIGIKTINVDVDRDEDEALFDEPAHSNQKDNERQQVIATQREVRAAKSGGGKMDIGRGLMYLGDTVKEGMLAQSQHAVAPPPFDVARLNNLLETTAQTSTELNESIKLIADVNSKLLELIAKK